MRWLVTGIGAIGGILGARLMEAGEEVTFLVRRPEARSALRDHGLTSMSRAAGERRSYPVNVLAPGESTEPFDVVLVVLRRDSIDEGFAASIQRAVGAETLLVPMISCFDLPEVLRARFGERCRIAGYPTGVGGWRGASETEIVAIVPRWGMHLILGPLHPGVRHDVELVAAAFRRARLRVRIVRDPLSYSRVSAIFLVALAEGIADDPRPVSVALRDAAVAARVLRQLRSTAHALHASGLRIPPWAQLPIGMPRAAGRMSLRLLTRGAFGEGLDRFLASSGRAEAEALIGDLKAMGLR